MARLHTVQLPNLFEDLNMWVDELSPVSMPSLVLLLSALEALVGVVPNVS